MQIACDTHVHCYQFEQLPQLLDQAMKNLNKHVPTADARVLFFTDGFVDRTWLNLQVLINENAASGNWSFAMNDSTGFVEASNAGEILYLAPARQVNTAGRLEVLLLGCDQELEDKQPANQLIEKYGDDYVLISPWGVGKWLGKRGRVLVDIINHAKKPFALGDNGGRPFFWPVPHFKFMQKLATGDQSSIVKRTLPILNGSDPLPITGELSRIGSYGVSFEISNELSVSNVLDVLRNPEQQAKNFGKPLGLFQFAIARLKMILR